MKHALPRLVTALVVVVVVSAGGCAGSVEAPRVQRASRAASAIINGTLLDTAVHPNAFAVIANFDGAGGAAVFCSSSLIAPDVIMTAAHCAAAIDSDIAPAGGTVFVSHDALLDASTALPADAVAVTAHVIAPGFDINTNPAPDVALLFLATPINDVTPALLLHADESAYARPGQEIEVAGWGLRTPGGTDAGEKFHATTTLQMVTPALIGYGIPFAGQSAVNKCNGDSGGPTYVNIDDGSGGALVRVIGVASRSDCQTLTIDVRPDAFASFFDTEMRNRCGDGSRTACAIPGLPSPADLGQALLPPAQALSNPRQVPASVEPALEAAAAHAATCFGVATPDDFVLSIGRDAFAVGAAACSGSDADLATAYYTCLSTVDCGTLQTGAPCSSESAAVDAAISACTDLDGTVSGSRVDEMDPEFRAATDDLCSAYITCGLFTGTVADCETSISQQEAGLLDANCADAEYETSLAFECEAGQSCDALSSTADPGDCFANATNAINDSFNHCDAVPAGEGEGEGAGGEGEGSAGEGEGEGGPDGNAFTPSPSTSGCLGCNNSGADAVALWGVLGVVLALPRRRRRAAG